jgi:hypothetical protein
MVHSHITRPAFGSIECERAGAIRTGPVLTCYDMEHAVTYMRLLGSYRGPAGHAEPT